MTGATADAPAQAAPVEILRAILKDVRAEIDGVTYVASDLSRLRWAQKLYLETIFLEAGLEEPQRLMRRDAPWQDNVKPLLLALYHSGRTFDFVAGALVREGQKWTEPAARVLALRLADLDDDATQANLQQLIAVFIASFFLSGRTSWTTSPSASVSTDLPWAPSSETSEQADAPSEGPSISASTAPSSADSLATIQTG